MFFERYISNSPVKTSSLLTKLLTSTVVLPDSSIFVTFALAMTRSSKLTDRLNWIFALAVRANSSLMRATARELA